MRNITLILFCIFNASFNLLSQSLDLISLIPQCKPSVVTITTYNQEEEPLASGTGFFIDSTGVVVSCYHIFIGAFKAEIETAKGERHVVTNIKYWSEKKDLIAFSIENSTHIVFPYLRRSSASLRDGESVFTIGNPMGLEYSISDGVISAIRYNKNYGKIIQFTAPISHGNSGSPLINANGEFVGIISFGLVEGQNLNFAIDAFEMEEMEEINELRFPNDKRDNLKFSQNDILRAKWGESFYKIQGREKDSDLDEFSTKLWNSIHEVGNNYTKCLVYE
ncbi:MAG: trypsin-like peptidase domain-containing protein, partial [Bacteroidetes bacterium]|nr:trypsin-like peptidase domain-containing protein [Bacteroidota bacterium]